MFFRQKKLFYTKRKLKTRESNDRVVKLLKNNKKFPSIYIFLHNFSAFLRKRQIGSQNEKAVSNMLQCNLQKFFIR